MIKIIKLVTGEEVLTKVEVVDGGWKLIKPMMLVMHQQGLQMVPWLMLAAKEEVIISEKRIVMMYEPKTELVQGYQQQTGGIVTAPATALNDKGKLQL